MCGLQAPVETLSAQGLGVDLLTDILDFVTSLFAHSTSTYNVISFQLQCDFLAYHRVLHCLWNQVSRASRT